MDLDGVVHFASSVDAAAPSPEVAAADAKLRFLKSLSHGDALRYKAAQAAAIPADIVAWMLAEHMGGAGAVSPASFTSANGGGNVGTAAIAAVAGAGASILGAPPALNDDAREDLAVALCASTKAFVLALCEAAVAAQKSEEEGTGDRVAERHVLEAWRALLSDGSLPCSPEWSLGNDFATSMAVAGRSSASVSRAADEEARSAGGDGVAAGEVVGGGGGYGDVDAEADDGEVDDAVLGAEAPDGVDADSDA